MKNFLRLSLFTLIFLILTIVLAVKFTTQTFAQAPYTATQTYPAFMPATNPDVQPTMHTAVSSIILDFASVSFCFITGYDPLTPDNKCLGIDFKTKKIGYSKSTGGALGLMTYAIGQSYALPVHLEPYLHYMASNFHGNLTLPSFAATPSVNENGVGAQGLDPILQIWIATRNAAYLLLVVVFVVIGVGIMFRIKIDPRTVMSLQNQIPKIIIGLLLITFSFAISGFLIDMTYVITLLFLNILGNAQINGSGAQLQASNLFVAPDPFSAVQNIFSDVGIGGIGGAANAGAQTVAPVVTPFIGNVPVVGGILLLLLTVVSIIPAIICTVGSWFGSGSCSGGFGPNETVSFLIYLALLVAILVALFRFWLALINAYLTIIFTVILAPLRILLGGFPGAPGGGFGGYIRDMLANLFIFPVSLGYIMLAALIAKALNPAQQGGVSQTFILPLVPGTNVGPIVALAAIMMLPKIPDVVKEAFKSKDVFGTAVGQAIAIGAGATSQGVKKFGSRMFQRENSLQGQSEGLGRKLLMGWTPNNPLRNTLQRALGEKTHSAG